MRLSLLALAVALAVWIVSGGGVPSLAPAAAGRGEAPLAPAPAPGLEGPSAGPEGGFLADGDLAGGAREPGGARQIRALGAPDWRTPLRGRLVDVLSGEPLSHLQLEFEGEVTATDLDGWFRTARDYPEGSYPVVLGTDRHAGWRATFAHVRGGYRLGVPERRVSSGPRYPLRWPGGDVLAGGRMQLVPSLEVPQGSPQVFGTIHSRSGASWAQFPPLPRGLEHAGPWTLEYRERVEQGFVQGAVRSVATSAQEPVVLERIDAASLEILITDPRGLVPSSAEVILRAPGRRWERAPSMGLLKLGGLRPGVYQLEVRGDGFYEEHLEFELAAGQSLDLPVALEPVLGDGEIQVVLESASGGYRGRSNVLLTPIELDEAGLGWDARSKRVTWREEGGAWIGTCVFEGLPEGEYELSAQGGRFHCWAPGSRRVRPGADATVLRLLDRGDESDLVLRVFDGTTGDWLDEFLVELTGDGCGKQFSTTRRVAQGRADRGAATLIGVPPTVQVRWCVSRDGYERRCGDMLSFGAPQVIDGQRVRIADVHLDPTDSVERSDR